MKKILLITFIFVITNSLTAQTSFSDINSSHKWVWLGLDFSNTKLIGRAAFSNPEKIINEYFPKINMLVFNEADKYGRKMPLPKTFYVNNNCRLFIF